MALPKVFTHAYSDGTKFHWTRWGSRKIPLLESGGEYRPISSIEDNIAFCELLLHVLTLRPEFIDAAAIEEGDCFRCHLKGNESRLSYLDWDIPAMSPSGTLDLDRYRNGILKTLAALKAGKR